MKQIDVQDDAELIAYVNEWLKNRILKLNSKNVLVQLPAGNTPQAIYKSWESQHPDFLNNLSFQQVDDVLTGPKQGIFKKFFEEQLPSYRSQFMSLTETPIKADMVILGVGTNGHLAFHEPEINLNFNYGCVRLSSTTCENLKLTEPTWGVSYGVGHFMQCPSVLIIVKGQNKQAILQKSLSEKSPTSPFSYVIKNHQDCTLLGCQVPF